MDNPTVTVAEWQDGSGVYDVWVDGKLFYVGIGPDSLWEARVSAYESLGATRSDAQAIVDCEDEKAGRERHP